uniref:Uncharacterized protein n=1 Tax=Phlebotomus papatasi TaxID=29031 RepID=A0A1B0DDB6_PHLPP
MPPKKLPIGSNTLDTVVQIVK